jgi:hypothetical protein
MLDEMDESPYMFPFLYQEIRRISFQKKKRKKEIRRISMNR